MNRLLRCFVSAILLSSTPVHAGWENTEWGMTPDEVIAVTDGAAYEPNSLEREALDGFSRQFFHPDLIMPTEIEGWPTTIAFGFEGGLLLEVAIVPGITSQDACSPLEQNVRAELGEPSDWWAYTTSFIEEGCSFVFYWIDRDHNQEVTYSSCYFQRFLPEHRCVLRFSEPTLPEGVSEDATIE